MGSRHESRQHVDREHAFRPEHETDRSKKSDVAAPDSIAPSSAVTAIIPRPSAAPESISSQLVWYWMNPIAETASSITS